jgi:hypothetical protein
VSRVVARRASRHRPGSLRIAVVWIVVVSAGLLGYATATGIRAGAVVVVVPFSAAALAWLAPERVGALVVADALLVATVVFLLIGGERLLYLPPLVLLVIATPNAAR